METLNILLEVTIYAAIIFGAILLIKKTLGKKFSPALHCFLWFLLIARLLLPVTLESSITLFSLPPEVIEVMQPETPAATLGNPRPENAAEQVTPTTTEQTSAQKTPAQQTATPVQSQTFAITWQQILLLVWLAGVAVSVIYLIYSYVKLYKTVRCCSTIVSAELHSLLRKCKREAGIPWATLRVRVVGSGHLDSPALMFPNIILLPEGLLQTMDDRQLQLALLHELTHYKRKDHIVSLLMLCLRAVYWFNPIVWVANNLLHEDIETACDNSVVSPLSLAERNYYANTVLSMFTNSRKPQTVLGMALGHTRKIAEKRIRGIFMGNKSRRGMKAVAVALCAVVFFVCFTTACQPTPEREIVVSKADSDAVADARAQAEQETSDTQMDDPSSTGTKLKDLTFPEGNYTYSTEGVDGDLQINVDAPIVLPESGQLPVARVEPGGFSQEQVTEFFNYLFPGGKAMNQNYEPTKGEIEQQIIEAKQQDPFGGVEDGAELTDEDRAMMQKSNDEYIQALEEQYANAPEERPADTVADGTMRYDESKKCMELNVAEEERLLFVSNDYDLTTDNDVPMQDPSLWYVNSQTNYTMDGAVRLTPGQPLPEGAQGKITMPLDEAIALADGFLDAGSVNDMRLAYAFLIDNHGTGHVDNDYSPASSYAYQLIYTRTVGGTPVAIGSKSAGSATEFDVVWFQESLEFFITDDGFAQINWLGPHSITEVVSEDVDIISFEEAVQRFETSAVVTFSPLIEKWGDDIPEHTIDVNVDEIRLELIRLKEKNTAGEKKGVYVPAYLFYGTAKEHAVYEDGYVHDGYVTSSGGGNDLYPGPIPMFAINAMDGSVIDVMNGY